MHGPKEGKNKTHLYLGIISKVTQLPRVITWIVTRHNTLREAI